MSLADQLDSQEGRQRGDRGPKHFWLKSPDHDLQVPLLVHVLLADLLVRSCQSSCRSFFDDAKITVTML